MTVDTLLERLRADRIVVLSAADWTTLADCFPRMAKHDTLVAGDLLIVETASGLAAVEQPKASERVVRLLGGREDADRFVQQRLELYERMWDGCGCKVDYYT